MATTSLDEMKALLAEAQQREQAHRGVWFTLDGQRFELWPRRLTFAQRKTIRSVVGRPIESAMSDLLTGEVGADTVAGLVWASLYQDTGKQLPRTELDALVAWVNDCQDFDAGEVVPPSELAREAGDSDDPADTIDEASDPEA